LELLCHVASTKMILGKGLWSMCVDDGTRK